MRYLAHLWELATTEFRRGYRERRLELGVRPERQRLPNRRCAERRQLKYQNSAGSDLWADVSFGFDRAGRVKEVFCIAAQDGSDMQGLVHDACIATSIALQFGANIGDLAKSFGELREEGQKHGRPASVIGALVRLGAAVEQQVVGEGAG